MLILRILSFIVTDSLIPVSKRDLELKAILTIEIHKRSFPFLDELKLVGVSFFKAI